MSAPTRLSRSAPPTVTYASSQNSTSTSSSIGAPPRHAVSDSELAALTPSSSSGLSSAHLLMQDVAGSDEQFPNLDDYVEEHNPTTIPQQVRQIPVRVHYGPPLQMQVLTSYFSQPPTEYSAPLSSVHHVPLHQSHLNPYLQAPIYYHEPYFSYPMGTGVPTYPPVASQSLQLGSPGLGPSIGHSYFGYSMVPASASGPPLLPPPSGEMPGPPFVHAIPPYNQPIARGFRMQSPTPYHEPYSAPQDQPPYYDIELHRYDQRRLQATYARSDSQPGLQLPPTPQSERSRSSGEANFPFPLQPPQSSPPLSSSQGSYSSSRPRTHSHGVSIVGSRPRTSSKSTKSHEITRSEWVMWVGNVPVDASHEELHNFFAKPVEPKLPSTTLSNGVISIFPILKSRCAFVNFTKEEFLQQAIQRFNGQPLRSIEVDPGCPKLVCQIREKINDPFSTSWKSDFGTQSAKFKENRLQTSEGNHLQTAPDISLESPSIYTGLQHENTTFNLSGFVSPENSGNTTTESSAKVTISGGSESYASSGFGLAPKLFSNRYFILKSLSKYDLDLSVKRGLWATQLHNEPNLNKAYRTTKTVYLIFSVNKSGEFFGYAKMTGHISTRGNHRHSIEWASRAPGSGTSSSRTPPSLSLTQPTIPEDSPDIEQEALVVKRQSISNNTASVEAHQDLLTGTSSANTHEESRPNEPAGLPMPLLGVLQKKGGSDAETRAAVIDELPDAPGPVSNMDGKSRTDGWGSPFKVKWIRTTTLNFHLTKHLKNPWNQNREVRLARDGTEIEPSVGELLLSEWESGSSLFQSTIVSLPPSGSESPLVASSSYTQ